MTPDRSGTALSVVIPTHLPRSLNRTLQALSRQTEPGFEVIVVENGSGSDAAEALCSQWKDRLTLRYRFDPTAGLNRARNTGTRMALGRYVALLDDVSMPSRRWTESVLDCFRCFPNAGVIGGPVALELESPAPDWLVGEFRTCLSELGRGPEAKVLEEGEYLFGANMAFPAAVFRKVGGFPEEIGMNGRKPPQLANDEIAFLDAVSRHTGDSKLVYCPDMSVTHHIPADRVSLVHMFQRRYGQGLSDVALLDWRHGPDMDKVLERYLNSVFPHPWHRQKLEEVLRGLEPAAADRYLRYHVVCRTAYLCGYRWAMSELPHAQPDVSPTGVGGINPEVRCAKLGRRIERMITGNPTQMIVSAVSGLMYRGMRPGSARALKQADNRLRLLVSLSDCLEPGVFNSLPVDPGRGAASDPEHGDHPPGAPAIDPADTAVCRET